jgi:hypothetical protein
MTMTTTRMNETTKVSTAVATVTKTTTVTTTAMHIVLTEEDRARVTEMLEALKGSLLGTTPETEVDAVIEKLTSTPGAASADALRPLIKCLPPAVAARLPEILEAEGAVAEMAILSHLGKDVMFRTETAIAYGSAFLALTDLECDSARQLRGY